MLAGRSRHENRVDVIPNGFIRGNQNIVLEELDGDGKGLVRNGGWSSLSIVIKELGIASAERFFSYNIFRDSLFHRLKLRVIKYFPRIKERPSFKSHYDVSNHFLLHSFAIVALSFTAFFLAALSFPGHVYSIQEEFFLVSQGNFAADWLLFRAP